MKEGRTQVLGLDHAVEVANLDIHPGIQEDVLWFYVAMNNTKIVQSAHAKQNLEISEPTLLPE